MTPRPSPGARLRTHAGVLVLLVTATSVGCGGDSTSDSAGPASPGATSPSLPSGDATAGFEVAGQGYSLLAPAGWADTTEDVRAQYRQVDAAAGDPAVAGGFTDNVNVIVSEPPIRTQRKAERILRRQLDLVGSDVRVHEPAELDGEVAYHATARLEVGRIKVRTSQYFARHEKAWYLVTFSYGPQTDAETQAEEIQAMLDSWTWD